MIRQVVISGKFLLAEMAAVVSAAVVFGDVPLPVGFVSELKAALVADEWLYACKLSSNIKSVCCNRKLSNVHLDLFVNRKIFHSNQSILENKI